MFINQRAFLDEVERASQSLDEEEYGQCSECGQPIPEKRLQAIPRAPCDVMREAQREAANL